MGNTNLKLLTICFLAMFSSASFAADYNTEKTTVQNSSDKALGLSWSGNLWSKYTYDTSTYPGNFPTPGTANTGVPKQGIDVYRMYLQGNYQYDQYWRAVFLTDVSRALGVTATSTTTAPAATTTTTVSSTTNDWVYMRQLFVENSDIGYGVTFRFGYSAMPVTYALDSYTGHRWMTTNFHDASAVTEPFGGVTQFSGKLLDKKLEWTINAHNGLESINQTGPNDTGMGYLGMLIYTPFLDSSSDLKGLKILIDNDYLSPARTSTTASVTEGLNTTELDVLYKADYLTAVVETAYEQVNKVTGAVNKTTSAVSSNGTAGDGSPWYGWGVSANYKFGEDYKWSFFGKYYTGNTGWQDNNLGGRYNYQFGPTYTFKKDKLMTGLFYEVKSITPSAEQTGYTGTTATADTQSITWSWAANF